MKPATAFEKVGFKKKRSKAVAGFIAPCDAVTLMCGLATAITKFLRTTADCEI
jgi:hypothetical protein